jgi:hypothetical protein
MLEDTLTNVYDERIKNYYFKIGSRWRHDIQHKKESATLSITIQHHDSDCLHWKKFSVAIKCHYAECHYAQCRGAL